MQSLSDRESPCRTLSFPGKAKWLVSEAWTLFDVLRAETIRIKPKTRNELIMFNQPKNKVLSGLDEKFILF